MVQNKKCSRCQKEITSSKYYSFFTGKKGGKNLGTYKDGNVFCLPYAEKEKVDDIVYRENLIKVEYEVGNQTDEEILEFEIKLKNKYDF